MTRTMEIRLLVLGKLAAVENFAVPLATLRAAVNVTVRPLAQFSELLEHLDAMVAKGWVREGKSALDETEATWEITEKGKLQLRSA